MVRCRRVALTVDLHLTLHALVDRREFDVLAERFVALQEESELNVLDSVWAVSAPRTGRFQDLPSPHARLALMVLARTVQGAEGLAQEVAANGTGQKLAEVREKPVHVRGVILEHEPQHSHVQTTRVHRRVTGRTRRKAKLSHKRRFFP